MLFERRLRLCVEKEGVYGDVKRWWNGCEDDGDEQLWRQQGRGAVERLTELLGKLKAMHVPARHTYATTAIYARSRKNMTPAAIGAAAVATAS